MATPQRHNGRDDAPSFWLGLALGLLPLVVLIVGLTGYLVTRDDGSGSGSGEVSAVEVDPEPVATSTPELVIETTRPPVAPETEVVPPAARGSIVNQSVGVRGVLAAESAETWRREISTLAAELGYVLIDHTETIDAAETTAELNIVYPGAIVFAEGSEQRFASSPGAVFEVVAGMLNRGVIEVVVAAYAEPSDPSAARIALGRAEHIWEHLVELDVDPTDVAIDVRSLSEGADITGTDAPVAHRVDLELRFRP